MNPFYKWLICIIFLLNSISFAQLPVGASQTAPESYSDVPTSHWAYSALERMTSMGIFTGYPDGSFQGTKTLSRYEAAVIAARTLDYVDALILVLSGNTDIAEALKDAAQNVGSVTNFDERISLIEAQLDQAASLAYARALEERIIVLEGTLNDLVGEDLLPASPLSESNPDLPQSASDAVTSNSNIDNPDNNTSTANSTNTASSSVGLIATPLAEISLKTSSSYPLFLGFSPGVITSSGDVYFAVQFGYDNLLGPLGLSSRLVFNSGQRELRASLDASMRLQAFSDLFDLYGGLGLGVSIQPEGDALIIEVPFGFEYKLIEQLGLFGQVTTAYAFAPINDVDAQITLGINLRF